MTVAELIVLLQAFPEQSAYVMVNRGEYYPEGVLELGDYGSDTHPVWTCDIKVEVGQGGEDFHHAYDVAHGRTKS